MSTDNFEKSHFNPLNLSLDERVKELKKVMKTQLGINYDSNLLEQLILDQDKTPVFLNDTYQVMLHENKDVFSRNLPEGMTYLSIKRRDKKPLRSWEDLYEIKNALVSDGKQRWAVELFPPSHHLVNTSNQYHIWVYPKGYYPPFGFENSPSRLKNFFWKTYMKWFGKADIK
tara:strand:+ start:69 stop:584 length:516 start_codon:yes stop_codon:yes gene_type:complete